MNRLSWKCETASGQMIRGFGLGMFGVSVFVTTMAGISWISSEDSSVCSGSVQSSCVETQLNVEDKHRFEVFMAGGMATTILGSAAVLSATTIDKRNILRKEENSFVKDDMYWKKLLNNQDYDLPVAPTDIVISEAE